jgi:hypothetical protein
MGFRTARILIPPHSHRICVAFRVRLKGIHVTHVYKNSVTDAEMAMAPMLKTKQA